jgi:hypothetical protein
MLKMGLHYHKLWPKEGPKVFDPFLVDNRPNLFACKWCATYC